MLYSSLWESKIIDDKNKEGRKEGAKDNAAWEAKSRRCNHSHAPIRFSRRFTAVAGLVFMMRMSAPVVTLATEPPATPPGAERESVLWRADSLTHTFPGISYSQVIYDAYIALGERRTAASHSIPTRSYIHVVPYFQMLGPSALETFQDGEQRRAGRFGFWSRSRSTIFFSSFPSHTHTQTFSKHPYMLLLFLDIITFPNILRLNF